MDETRPSIGIGLALGFACGLLGKELGLRSLVSFWGDAAYLVGGFTLIVAILWRLGWRRSVLGLAGLLTLAWLVVALSPLDAWMARGIVRRDPLRPADAIYVLASSMQRDDDPTASALSRGTRGLELLGAGVAPKLLVAELPKPFGSYVAYLSSSAKQLHVPRADAIESVGVVRSTRDEAVLVAAWMKAHGATRLVLVTSPAHSRRASATFERAGVPEVISIPAVETQYDFERLSDGTDGRIFAFGSIAHEWVGLAYYRLRGWVR